MYFLKGPEAKYSNTSMLYSHFFVRSGVVQYIHYSAGNSVVFQFLIGNMRISAKIFYILSKEISRDAFASRNLICIEYFRRSMTLVLPM